MCQSWGSRLRYDLMRIFRESCGFIAYLAARDSHLRTVGTVRGPCPEFSANFLARCESGAAELLAHFGPGSG